MRPRRCASASAPHTWIKIGTTISGLRAEVRDELLEIDAVEILHRVIEDALGAAAVVEHRNRIRVRELTHVLDLALEAIERVAIDPIRQHELDRGGAAQQCMARAVDGAVTAFTDLGVQRVLAELHRLADLATQAVQYVRTDGGEQDRHDEDQDSSTDVER